MSEPKESESGDEAQAESESEAAEAAVSASQDAPGNAGSSDTAETADASETAAGEATSAPKKRKKKAREPAEPENIRDRNARVRAEAVEKRRARREREEGGAPRRNLDASEVMDDALARSTHAAASFLTKHFNKVQWLIMASLVGWIAFEVYSWRHARNAEKATDALFKALAAEMGTVGDGADADAAEDRGGQSDARRLFPSDEERLKAAKAEYVLASSSVSEGMSALADLGAAGVAYDLGDYKAAQTGFEKVKQHPSFASDNDIKGRTLEGLGLSLEAQEKGDLALKAFRELQNMDVPNFSALGLYHQARLLNGQGKPEDALKLLDKAGDKLASLKETPGVIKYIGSQVMELMETLDRKKAKELGTKLMSSDALKQMTESTSLTGPGGQKLSPELQKRIQEMMEKQQSQPAPMPGPVGPFKDAPPAQDAPPADAPAPDAPAPASSGTQ